MGDIFVLAVAAAFYPTLLAIVVLILSRPRPVRLLAGYLVGGMITGIGIGCLIVFALGGDVHSSRRTLSPIVDIVVGSVSLGFAVLLATGHDPRPARLRARRERIRAERLHTARESWTTRAMERDSVAVAFVLGVILDLPSIWYLAALKDIAKGGYGTGGQVLLIVAFNLIMFALIEVPLAAYLLDPERSRTAVARFNAWLHAHTRDLAEGIAGGVGAYLLVKGIVAVA